MKKGFGVVLTLSVAIITFSFLAFNNDACAKNNKTWKNKGSDLYYKKGNVGIGTSTPGARLEVFSEDAPLAIFGGTTHFVTVNFDRHGETKNSLGIAPEEGSGDITANAFVIGSFDGENWSDPLIIENGAPSGAIFINSAGRVGIGTMTPVDTLDVAGNITASGSITEGSSRELKKEISQISYTEAKETLKGLNPVKFKYKADYSGEEHLGFIAEDVPELVACQDRKRMSPMDIAAVTTKVVQEQQYEIQEQRKILQEQQRMISVLLDRIKEFEGKM